MRFDWAEFFETVLTFTGLTLFLIGAICLGVDPATGLQTMFVGIIIYGIGQAIW